MGGRGGSSGLSANGEKLEVGGRKYSLENFLKQQDINHANSASLFDAGDATKREFIKNANEINKMYFDDSEKQQYVKKLAEMTTSQLKAEAKAVNPYVSGPARFNKQQVSSNADRAAGERAKVNSYMNDLRKKSQGNYKSYRDKQLVNAMKKAESEGRKEFTFDGVTYKKKRKYWTN